MIDSPPLLRVADVCSGLGNFSLGLETTGFFETTSFCEIDRVCREWLEQEWPGVPIYPDLRDLCATDIGPIDVLVGGIPCQPASLAGSRKGSADERWLWPEFLRLATEALPLWIVAENPVGIVTVEPHGLQWIDESLEQAGYERLPVAVGANDCGAPHRRDRVWIIARLANADSSRVREFQQWLSRRRPDAIRDPGAGESGHHGEGMAHPHGRGRQELGFAQSTRLEGSSGHQLDGCDGSGIENARVGHPRGPGCAYLRGRRSSTEGSGHRSALSAGLSYRWPARRGEPQHDWEPPRVINITAPTIGLVGGLPDGAPLRLGLSLNRARLKALGNGITPQIPNEIGYAIARCEGLI